MKCRAIKNCILSSSLLIEAANFCACYNSLGISRSSCRSLSISRGNLSKESINPTSPPSDVVIAWLVSLCVALQLKFEVGVKILVSLNHELVVFVELVHHAPRILLLV